MRTKEHPAGLHCPAAAAAAAAARHHAAPVLPLSPAHCIAVLQTFLVGPKFKGVKMLPPGTHLVSYNASSGHGDFGPTTSFFLTVKAGEASPTFLPSSCCALLPSCSLCDQHLISL